jgi:hypothetical protein
MGLSTAIPPAILMAGLAVIVEPGPARAQPVPQSARQASLASSHRPWVGVGAGLGGVLGPMPAGGSSGLLASTLDLPLTPQGSIRFSAERLWSSIEGYGGLSLRQFSVDLFMRKPTGTLFGCSMFTVLGLGPGIYNISLESADLPDSTRLGYQFTLGQECIRTRVASGGAFGVRFVKMPGHAAFSNAVDIALTLSITLRIRL